MLNNNILFFCELNEDVGIRDTNLISRHGQLVWKNNSMLESILYITVTHTSCYKKYIAGLSLFIFTKINYTS